MYKKTLVTLASFALLLVATVPADAALRVVATLPDLGAIAAEVAGPGATVDVLVSHAQNPHYIDARPSHVVSLNRADLLVFNGADLEIGWLPPLLVQARNPRILASGDGHFDASQHVTLRGASGVDRAGGDVHPAGNPHFTWDPRVGGRLALSMGARMAKLDPANAAKYKARAQALASRLEKLAAGQTARFAALPASRRSVVTYHTSMLYLLDWLGLKALITVEPKPGIAPTPGHTAKVLSSMKSAGIGTVLQEGYYPRNTSQTLCKLAAAKLVVVDGGTRWTDGQSYPDHLEAVSDALFDALQR
jgi:zinc/manganese transport system substrate-binding protein